MEWASVLYAPIYAALAVPAELLPAGAADPITVRVIDKTAGTDVGDSIDIQTIRPAADIRASEVLAAGFTPGDLDGGTLTIDGRAWRIDSHFPRPGPAGETGGEIRMILLDESVYA